MHPPQRRIKNCINIFYGTPNHIILEPIDNLSLKLQVSRMGKSLHFTSKSFATFLFFTSSMSLLIIFLLNCKCSLGGGQLGKSLLLTFSNSFVSVFDNILLHNYISSKPLWRRTRPGGLGNNPEEC